MGLSRGNPVGMVFVIGGRPFSGDATVGIASTALGSGGLTLQAVMDGMSLALLGLNIMLCLAGLVLVGYRLRAVRQKHRSQYRNQ